MNTQQTFEQLKELKLYGIAGCYDNQLHQPAEKQPDSRTLIAMMAEAVSRINQRTNLCLPSPSFDTACYQYKSIAAPEETYPKNNFNSFSNQHAL
jgi:hypothetical protein